MINARCFGESFLNHPEATIDYSGLRKGGRHSENSFLIKQFVLRKGEGGRPTLVEHLGMFSHQDKEQHGRRKTAGDQSITFTRRERAALKPSG